MRFLAVPTSGFPLFCSADEVMYRFFEVAGKAGKNADSRSVKDSSKAMKEIRKNTRRNTLGF
jgi:ABC-type tungstate transport system permease subunit